MDNNDFYENQNNTDQNHQHLMKLTKIQKFYFISFFIILYFFLIFFISFYKIIFIKFKKYLQKKNIKKKTEFEIL
jgi:hypothetical protein